MNKKLEPYLDEIKRYFGITRTSGWHRMPCPFHNGKDKNFAFKAEQGLGVCHSRCDDVFTIPDFCEKIGIEKPKRYNPFNQGESWLYESVDNDLFRQLKNLATGGKKSFITQHKDKDDNWVSGKGTQSKALPYQHEAIEDHDIVYIVEGEKCVDEAQQKTKNLVTTSIGGSKAANKTDWSLLSGKEIIFIPDLDKPGFEYICTVSREIKSPKSLSVIHLKSEKEGYDIADYLEEHDSPNFKLEDLEKVDFEEWLNSMDEVNKHIITKDTKGLARAMRNEGIKIRYCILHGQEQIKRGDGEWLPIRQNEDNRIRTDIREKYSFQNNAGKKGRRANWSDADWKVEKGSILFDLVVNSFKVDYLDKLPEWEKGMTSSEDLFIEALGADDTELNRSIGRMIVQAIVERAYLPAVISGHEKGVKFDYLPILIGTDEGEGKSSFCEYLLPYPSLYGNRFNFADKDKEQQESILGKVVVEVNELIGLDKAKIESLKALLSVWKEPQIRMAYAKHPTARLRRCVFIGTTNDEECIPITGTRNRRFIPIVVGNNGRQHVVDWLNEYRDEIFAHGIHCMHNNEPLFLYGAVESDQKELVIDHTNKDGDEDATLETFYDMRIAQGTPFFTMADFVNHLYDCNSDSQQIKTLQDRNKWRLSKLFRLKGYKKRYCTPKGYKRAVYWFHPSEDW